MLLQLRAENNNQKKKQIDIEVAAGIYDYKTTKEEPPLSMILGVDADLYIYSLFIILQFVVFKP